MKKFAAIALALIVAMSGMFATVATAADEAVTVTSNKLAFTGFEIVENSGVIVDLENMLIYGLEPGLKVSDLSKYLKKGDVDDMYVVINGEKVAEEKADKAFIGTGTKIVVEKDGAHEFDVVIFGDVTGDSVYDVLDMVQVNRYAKGDAEPEDLDVVAVDTDSDGEIGVEDYKDFVNTVVADKAIDQNAGKSDTDGLVEIDAQVYTSENASDYQPVADEDITLSYNDIVVDEKYYTVDKDSYKYTKNDEGEIVGTVNIEGNGLFGGTITVEFKVVSLLEKIVATVNEVIEDANLADVVTAKYDVVDGVADIKVEVNASNIISGNFNVDVDGLNGLLTKIDAFKAKHLQEATLTVGDLAIASNGDFDRSAIKTLVFDIAKGIFCDIANADDNVVKSYSGTLVTNNAIANLAEDFNIDVVMTGTGSDIDKVKAFAAKISRYVAFDVVDGNAVVDITMPAGFATTVVDVIGDGDVDKAVEVFNSMTVENALLAFSLVDPEAMSSSSANAIKKLISIACGLDTAANKVLSEVKTATVTDANGKVIDLLNGKIFDVLGESNLENLVAAVLSVLSEEALNANIADFVNGDIYTAEFDVAVDYRNISEKVIVNFDFFGNAEAPNVIEETSTYFNSIIAELGLANVANVAYSADSKSAVASLDASAFINGDFTFNEAALDGLYTDIKGYFDDNYGTSTIVVGDYEIVTSGKINKTALKNFLFDVANGFFLDVADMDANNVIRNYYATVTEADGSSVDFDIDFALAGTDAHITKMKNISAKVADCISLSTVNGNAVIDVTLPAGFQNTIIEALSEDGTVESAVAKFDGLKVRTAFEALSIIDAETISAANASEIEKIILLVADYSSVINKLLGKVTSATVTDLNGETYNLLNGSDFDGSKIAESDNVFGAAVESIMSMIDDATLDADVADFTTGNGVYTVEFDVAVSVGGIEETVIVNFDMFGIA